MTLSWRAWNDILIKYGLNVGHNMKECFVVCIQKHAVFPQDSSLRIGLRSACTR